MDDFSFGTLEGTGPSGEAMFGGSRPFVKFYAASELLRFKSQEEGRPCYRKLDMIEMQTPGQRDNCIREVTEWHKATFKPQWDAYMAGQDQIAVGTPLAVLFPANPEVVDGMRGSKIHTVEQLAGLSDHAVQDLGLGALDFRAKAARFLEDAGKAAQFSRAEAAEASLAEMKKRMAELEAKLAARPEPTAAAEGSAAPAVEPMRRKTAPAP